MSVEVTVAGTTVELSVSGAGLIRARSRCDAAARITVDGTVAFTPDRTATSRLMIDPIEDLSERELGEAEQLIVEAAKAWDSTQRVLHVYATGEVDRLTGHLARLVDLHAPASSLDAVDVAGTDVLLSTLAAQAVHISSAEQAAVFAAAVATLLDDSAREACLSRLEHARSFVLTQADLDQTS